MSNCQHEKCYRDLCVNCCYCGTTLATPVDASGNIIPVDPYGKLLLGVAEMISQQKIEEDGKVLVKEAQGGFNLACDFTADKIRKLVAKGPPVRVSEHLTFQDYKDVINDHKRLVREIDLVISGDGAAQQASLVDLVGPIKEIMAELKCLREENKQLKEALQRQVQ